MINLSKRLQTIADFVTPGSRICDVAAVKHGFRTALQATKRARRERL